MEEGGTWLPEGAVLPLQQPNVIILALLMGSVTVQWAVDAVRRNDRPQAYLALGLTELFGFATLNMAAYLYSVMKLDASSGPMAVMTYAISGAHLAVLVAAMIFVALMAFRALGGQYSGRQTDGMLAAAIVLHVGTARARRLGAAPARQSRTALVVGIAFAILFVSIPWPFFPYGRPLFRLGG